MSSSSESVGNLEVLLDVPVKLSVDLGSCQMPMREVLHLAPGHVVQLDRPADAPVDVYVNQRLIAKGEIVVVEDHFAIKITKLFGARA